MGFSRRSNFVDRWGRRLALFALALQFCLSLGHVHGDLPSGDALPVLTLAGHAAPGEHPLHGVPPDQCDICASMAALASGALPGPVSLPVPALDATGIEPALLSPFELQGLQHLFARPRGPPVSMIV